MNFFSLKQYSIFLLGGMLWVKGALANPTHDALYQQALEIAREVRCPVCAGQSIVDSESPEAIALKKFVFSHVFKGESKDKVYCELRALYGDEILFQPPLAFHTLALWLIPFGLGFVVLGILAWKGLQTRRLMS